jgi:hypothetical protein
LYEEGTLNPEQIDFKEEAVEASQLVIRSLDSFLQTHDGTLIIQAVI